MLQNRPQDIIAFEVTTIFDTEELQARERDQPMFTPAVRRDIYRILRNPRDPQDGTPQMTNNMFDSVLLAKSVSSSNGGAWDSFAFAGPGANPRGYTVLDDEQMLEAISSIGRITPVALAVTQAFEAYLSQLVMTWGEREAACLSVEFLVAFGNEMTRRLDVNNRVRSTQLTAREIDVLKQQPFSNFVDAEALETYQSGNRGISREEQLVVPLASDYSNLDSYGRNNNYNQNSNSYYPNSNYWGEYGNSSMQPPARRPNDYRGSDSRMNSYSGNNNYNSNSYNNNYNSSPPRNYDGRSNYGDARSSFGGNTRSTYPIDTINNRQPPNNNYGGGRDYNRNSFRDSNNGNDWREGDRRGRNEIWGETDKSWYENF